MEPQKKSGGLWIVLIIIIIGVLVYLFMGRSEDNAQTNNPQDQVSNTVSAEGELNSLDTTSLENELGDIEKELQ